MAESVNSGWNINYWEISSSSRICIIVTKMVFVKDRLHLLRNPVICAGLLVAGISANLLNIVGMWWNCFLRNIGRNRRNLRVFQY